jgi:4-hydroxy-tetrahydrodipicolinate synthase
MIIYRIILYENKTMNKFKGLYTALITPFKGNQIDFVSLERIINKQLEAKVDGIVIAGSTGEIHALSDLEYEELLKQAVELCKGRTKIIAGIGYNTTAKTAELAQIAEKIGANGVMAVTPYYNKPTQEGLYRHYTEIHNNCRLPIIIYSVPGRTGVDISDQLLLRLAEFERIVAYKDASGDIEKPLRIIAKLKDRFDLLCGDDSWAIAYNANGGSGCISVASNIIPTVSKEIQDLTNTGKFKEALAIHLKYMELYKALFIESNPIPVKYALSLMGLCQAYMRLPLCELSINSKELVETTMKNLRLI